MRNLKKISIIIMLIIILSTATMSITSASENTIGNIINSSTIDLVEQPILTRASTSPARRTAWNKWKDILYKKYVNRSIFGCSRWSCC